MADRVDFSSQRIGKRKRLAELLVEAARAGADGRAISQIVETSKDQALTLGLGITRVSMDEVDGSLHQHQFDAMAYMAQQPARIHRVDKPLSEFSDAELVMEMIRRGYAAMKLPKDGGPPEVLR